MDNLRRRAVGGFGDPVTHRGIVDGHEAVDLGLPSGLLWATMDIGQTQDYSDQSTADYYTYGGQTAFTPPYYNNRLSDYYTGSETVLPLGSDVARQLWGGGWRMPTKEEAEEFISNTNIDLNTNGTMMVGSTRYNNCYGRLFYAKNDNTNNTNIYFSARTCYYVLNGSGAVSTYPGMIRTSTNGVTRYGNCAYVLVFPAGRYNSYTYGNSTYYSAIVNNDFGSPTFTMYQAGLSVRPVHDPI